MKKNEIERIGHTGSVMRQLIFSLTVSDIYHGGRTVG